MKYTIKFLLINRWLGSFIGLFESLIAIFTLGIWHPAWSLRWIIFWTMREARARNPHWKEK